MPDADLGLRTLEGGEAPECRLRNAQDAQDVVRRLINADQKRSRKRALVAGLVDGNPPLSTRKLREMGSGARCNVNFGTARAYLESATGAYYDLFSQAPGYVSIQTSHGNEQQQVEWSRILSEEADESFRNDEEWDNDVQLSQNEMVLNGCGPMFFEDEHSVFPLAVQTGDLLVPERTPTKPKRWEIMALVWDYYPPELFKSIKDEAAAETVGWNVKFVKKVIENAMSVRQQEGTLYNWEWYQNELKSNSMSYYDETKICKCAHVFWKEFDGRISHAIVERETTGGRANGGQNPDGSKANAVEYLFLKVGRYANFNECLHAMYQDRGRGGFHHNVTGQGVKMYGPMEHENRLLCNLYDKANAPKTLFKPTTQEAATKFSLAVFSDYAVVPPGVDVEQSPIQGFLTDGLAMFRTSADLMRSNLSAYRTPVEMDKPGNPATAFEKKLQASETSSLSGTTFNRYYKQLDFLYREIVRRLCNLTSTDDRAKAYQKRCTRRGVPRECFGRVSSVQAVRVVGQGSPFMRQQALQSIADVVMGNEAGLNNWRNDRIAAAVGAHGVSRYNPTQGQKQLADEQKERANNQLVAMHAGQQATISASQNPLIFAGTFLSACVQALTSVQKGADPQEVVRFLDLAAPAAAAQIQRMQRDPLRQQVIKPLMDRWKQVAKLTDQLKKKLQEQAKKQKDLQQKAGQVMTDAQVKAMKAQGDLALKAQKQNFTQRLAWQKHRQQLAIADASAASEIRRNNLRAFAEPAAAE